MVNKVYDFATVLLFCSCKLLAALSFVYKYLCIFLGLSGYQLTKQQNPIFSTSLVSGK